MARVMVAHPALLMLQLFAWVRRGLPSREQLLRSEAVWLGLVA
jgi:hypothetical protein